MPRCHAECSEASLQFVAGCSFLFAAVYGRLLAAYYLFGGPWIS